MRLIDADAVLEWFAKYWAMQKKLGRPSKQQQAIYMTMRTMVNSVKTVDAVPVRHGKWRFVNCATGWRCQCSECLHWVDAGADKNYCPNCGARMDKE